MKGNSLALRTAGVEASAKAREVFPVIKRPAIPPEHSFSKEKALVRVITPQLPDEMPPPLPLEVCPRGPMAQALCVLQRGKKSVSGFQINKL